LVTAVSMPDAGSPTAPRCPVDRVPYRGHADLGGLVVDGESLFPGLAQDPSQRREVHLAIVGV